MLFLSENFGRFIALSDAFYVYVHYRKNLQMYAEDIPKDIPSQGTNQLLIVQNSTQE